MSNVWALAILAVAMIALTGLLLRRARDKRVGLLVWIASTIVIAVGGDRAARKPRLITRPQAVSS
jgi:hypothetical protein